MSNITIGLIARDDKINDTLVQIITKNNLKYLHTVVEREIDGINYIYDWTKNLFIKEEDYIKLTHFDVISSCNINDIDKNDPLLNITSLLPYFVFKNELESDLQRNKKILHK